MAAILIATMTASPASPTASGSCAFREDENRRAISDRGCPEAQMGRLELAFLSPRRTRRSGDRGNRSPGEKASRAPDLRLQSDQDGGERKSGRGARALRPKSRNRRVRRVRTRRGSAVADCRCRSGRARRSGPGADATIDGAADLHLPPPRPRPAGARATLLTRWAGLPPTGRCAGGGPQGGPGRAPTGLALEIS